MASWLYGFMALWPCLLKLCFYIILTGTSRLKLYHYKLPLGWTAEKGFSVDNDKPKITLSGKIVEDKWVSDLNDWKKNLAIIKLPLIVPT